MTRTLAAIVAAIFAAQASALTFTPKTKYPRISIGALGGPWTSAPYSTTSYQDGAGRFDAILSNMTSVQSVSSANAAIARMKAVNPNIAVINYVDVMEASDSGTGDYATRKAKLDAQSWWVYANFTTPPKLKSKYGITSGFPFFQTNMTNAVASDGSGLKWNTWVADWMIDNHINRINIDGIFTDNCTQQPAVDGDYALNGGLDGLSTAAVPWRVGFKAYHDAMFAQNSQALYACNNGPWENFTPAQLPQYDQMVGGGMMELAYPNHAGCDNANVCAPGGAAAWVTKYQRLMAFHKSPKLLIIQNRAGATNYKGHRYTMAFTHVIGDGYYSHDPGGYFTPTWHDENHAPGVATLPGERDSDWLGDDIDPPQTAPKQQGVYVRKFTRGAVVWNPAGNGQKTIQMPGYHRFLGVEVPSVNNGQPTDSLVIADGDGIFLVADQVQPPPDPDTVRIEVGGSTPFVDGESNTWAADVNFTGGSKFTTAQPISGTTDDTLYQSQRFGAFSYAIPIANGSKDLRLQFAETTFDAAGFRVFDVFFEGQLIFDDLDVWNESGARYAALEKFAQVQVNDGVANITFTASVDQPFVSGIEMVPTSATNQAPTASAGADQTITLPAQAQLDGGFGDDGLPDPPGATTTAWTKVSGPGTVTFADATNPASLAGFSLAGVYVLRLTANDSALTATDDVTITVQDPQPPEVTSLVLVQSQDPDFDIGEITPGAVFVRDDLDHLNAYATTDIAAGSVELRLDALTPRVENVAPMSLCGHVSGNFDDCSPAMGVGTHTITAQAWSGANKTGQQGTLFSRTFTLQQPPPPSGVIDTDDCP